MATCELCGDSVVSDDPTNYYEVRVWVHGPKQDGATARSRTGKVAHQACIVLLKDGQAPDQEKLF